MELVNLMLERLLVATRDFTLNMLLIQDIGVELFTLQLMHLIRVELMALEGTVIIYRMERRCLMEVLFQMEPIWSFLQKFKLVSSMFVIVKNSKSLLKVLIQ